MNLNPLQADEQYEFLVDSLIRYLDYLQELYPGLDGKVKVKPIYLEQISNDRKFSELSSLVMVSLGLALLIPLKWLLLRVG